MANYDEFVQFAAETAEVFAGKSATVFKKATDGAKTVVRAGKLNVDIAAEREAIRRSYTALGKLYYELHRDDAEETLRQAVEEISASGEKIAALRAELEELRGGDDGIDVEVYEAEPETEPGEEPEKPVEPEKPDNVIETCGKI